MTTAIRLYRTYIQSTFVPLNTIRSVPEGFQGSREPLKPSGTPRSLILPSVPEGFQKFRETYGILVHPGSSLPPESLV